MMEKCVELHKSGKGYNEIATCPILILPILKKFKATGTGTNSPGRGHVYFAPTYSEEDEAKNSPRIIVGELQRKVTSCGHQLSKTTFRCHLNANYLKGVPDKSLSCHFTTNVVWWRLCDAGAVFSPKALGTLLGYMASSHFKSESGCPCQETWCHGIFQIQNIHPTELKNG